MKRFTTIAVVLALLVTACLPWVGASASTVPVEITFMIWANETEAETAQKVLDTYNGSQDGAKVNLSYVPETEYITKINTLAAAGSLPDVAMGREAVVLKWAANGLLADVSQMYADGPAPLASLGFTYEGKVVAYSSANEVLLLYYNRDLFDAAGIEYPPATADGAWTWAEFVEAAKKLTKDANGKTPNDEGFNPNDILTYGAYVDTLSWMWPVFAASNGGGLVSADGSEILLDKPESIEAAQAIADLYLVDHVAPAPAAAASFPTLDVTLLSGQIAMATGGQWNIGTTLANSLADGLNYGVAVLPKFKEAVTYNTGGPLVIFASTKQPDASMDFLKWYTQEDNNWGLIESGIWMPILDSWYTDEALTHKWVDNPNFPPYDEYKSAVVDYAMNNAQQVPWYYLPCYSRLEEVLDSAMGAVWLGDKTAEQAITEIAPTLKSILADGGAD
ncbi:hypothetical protein AGMMS49992_02790 [Clostridia bacterium]|nr:hypothetical protein AGMMS49992_02790 [Clostridia bacterium]